MASKVYANGMSISNKGSGAFSTVFPDVCKTPVGSSVVPVPYPNTAKSADIADGTVTVKIEGEMATNKGCNYSTSVGDEAGSAKGVASGKTKGKAEFMLSSFDVKIEGKNACRTGDTMTHNNRNAVGMGNIDGTYVPPAETSDDEEQDKKKDEVTVRVSLFFDGTANNRLNARALPHDTPTKGRTDSFKNDVSNIAKLEEAWIEGTETDYSVPVYVEGIGTVDLQKDNLNGLALGKGDTGVKGKVDVGYEKLMRKVGKLGIDKEEKKIKHLYVDVFGFSRGAAAARYFVHCVLNSSGERQKLKDVFAAHGYTVDSVKIKFVGLFDTVASYGLIHENDKRQLKLDAITAAEYVLQLGAGDEHRKKFGQTNIKSAVGKNGCEIYLPSVHADIGGGYIMNHPEDFVVYRIEGRVSSAMKKKLEKERQRLIDQGWYKEHELTIGYKWGTGGGKGSSLKVDRGEVRAKRTVESNEYSLIPLHIMSRFAQHYKVNVSKKVHKRHKIPPDLKRLRKVIDKKVPAPGALKLIDATVWDEEMTLINRYRHKYFHFSANYRSIVNHPRIKNDERKRRIRNG